MVLLKALLMWIAPGWNDIPIIRASRDPERGATACGQTPNPRVDPDGKKLGGVPLVLRDAPLGAYLGWNITATVYSCFVPKGSISCSLMVHIFRA